MNFETHVPHWEWYYVALYFYIGGVSAGAYFVASLAELFGGERLREVSRIGYYLALPLILLTPILLIADLGQPGRFWHLFLYAGNGLPYINWQSPLSVGSWALMLYGGFALLSFLDNLVTEGRLAWAPLARLYNRMPRKVYALIGSATGIFVAGYTGVLLNVTARPLWAATDPFLGPLFVVSGASTGAAAIALIMVRRARDPGRSFGHLETFDRLALLIELLLIVVMVIVAGKYALPLLTGLYGVLFLGGTVAAGILAPLWLTWSARNSEEGSSRVALAAILVLVGGALLRICLVQAGQV